MKTWVFYYVFKLGHAIRSDLSCRSLTGVWDKLRISKLGSKGNVR